jgi:hypothetical protein
VVAARASRIAARLRPAARMALTSTHEKGTLFFSLPPLPALSCSQDRPGKCPLFPPFPLFLQLDPGRQAGVPRLRTRGPPGGVLIGSALTRAGRPRHTQGRPWAALLLFRQGTDKVQALVSPDSKPSANSGNRKRDTVFLTASVLWYNQDVNTEVVMTSSQPWQSSSLADIEVHSLATTSMSAGG